MVINLNGEVSFPADTAYLGSPVPINSMTASLFLLALLLMVLCGFICNGAAGFYSTFIETCMEQVSYEGMAYENFYINDMPEDVDGNSSSSGEIAKRNSSSSDESGKLWKQVVEADVHVESGENSQQNGVVNDAENKTEDHIKRISVYGSSTIFDSDETRIEIQNSRNATVEQNVPRTRTRQSFNFDEDINAINEEPWIEEPVIEVSSEMTRVERNRSFQSRFIRLFEFISKPRNRVTSASKSS